MVEVCALGVGFVASLCVFIRRGTPVGRLGGSEDGHGDALVLRWAAFVLLQRVCVDWVGGVFLGRIGCVVGDRRYSFVVLERLWRYDDQHSCFPRGCTDGVRVRLGSAPRLPR